jgi:hypothetical protein
VVAGMAAAAVVDVMTTGVVAITGLAIGNIDCLTLSELGTR